MEHKSASRYLDTHTYQRREVPQGLQLATKKFRNLPNHLLHLEYRSDDRVLFLGAIAIPPQHVLMDTVWTGSSSVLLPHTTHLYIPLFINSPLPLRRRTAIS